MGRQYKHLSEQDRVFIEIMLNKRYSKSKIAKILKVHVSTIYRELKRNMTEFKIVSGKFYNAMFAHKNYLDRRQRPSKLDNDPVLKEYVHKKLSCGWSPSQIEGRLKLENNGISKITHETIYRYIYSDFGIRNELYKKLRRQHFWRLKRKARKSKYPPNLLIKHRPEDINDRLEFGHWECDLMMFKRGIKSNLITIRERKSRFLIAIKNDSKKADTTAIRIISTLKNIKEHIKSITFDQGSEFSKYQWIKDTLETDIYFCDPGSPEQKASVENINGVIRSYLPRRYDIDALKQINISEIAREINAKPLKCLGYQTPFEIFNNT